MFDTFPIIKIYHVSVAVNDNIPLLSNGKKPEKTAIEDVEDDVYELPDSYSTKTATGVFGEIDIGKANILPLSYFVEFIEAFG